MDKKPIIMVSILAVVLLVLGSLSNVLGYQTVQSSNQSVIKERINQRELLFQTIVDIANNKEIQRIILKSQMISHPILILLLRLIFASRNIRWGILHDISSYDTHWGTVVVFPLIYKRAWRLYDKAENRVDIWIYISDMMGWGWTEKDIRGI